MSNSARLDKEKAAALLKPGSALSCSVKCFESREQQQHMLCDIVDAFNKNQIALIEAGTGTGKSLAYLIPAMLWAMQNKERTLISTHTINLQEQLIHKDIPLAAKALSSEVKAVLVKGMSNYICLRKLEETKWEKNTLSLSEAEEFDKIEPWSEKTADGSLSDLTFMPSRNIWEKVCAESDTCNKNKCKYYSKCHFYKARKEAEEAQILVANHSLLFADLAFRSESEPKKGEGLLPNYTRIVIDEAHNIEDVATEFFAKRVSHLQIIRLLSRLGSETQGKLPLLSKKLASANKGKQPEKFSAWHDKLTIDLPGTRRDLLHQINETFHAYGEFIQNAFLDKQEWGEANSSETKWRILPFHWDHPRWSNEVLSQTQQLIDSCKKYTVMINHFDDDLDNIKDPHVEDQLQGLRHEIKALALRLVDFQTNFERFISKTLAPSEVRWIEMQNFKTMTNHTLVEADIDIAKALASRLFCKFPTIVLCSATMTTNQNFSFVRKRLGLTAEFLPGKAITESIYPSPFDYHKQALLAIPMDMPDPSHPEFISAACERIWDAVRTSKGNAFVLFTSYAMLTACYNKLKVKLEKQRFCVLKQGEMTRKALLEKFKATNASILFGTDSFWQGVDVAGDALRCVILVKLPFKVPTEPLMQARTEAIISAGGDPFYDYSVPNAIVKFKQGFGRLIRNKNDRGCILCLDPRIATKPYGKLFLNSLPSCRQILSASEAVHKQMADFYWSKERRD